MPLKIQDTVINKVLVIDDDPASRESCAYAIEDMELEPVPEDGPIDEIEGLIASLREGKADAIFCDYRLQINGAYAPFNGDSIVSTCCQRGIPSLLCSSYADIDVTIDRSLLRNIPVILRTHQPEPDVLINAYKDCVEEIIIGLFRPTRKPWKTLVRVEEVEKENQIAYVIVPGWNPERKIRLYIDNLPVEIHDKVVDGARFHAEVNTGARDDGELYFSNWTQP
jgi:hypothetical protein